MPGPSDYRYEPFSDISSGVTLTERHLIPATSPYVVRLNEVPQKNSPSTMMVKEITDVNGEVITYGSTFDEVAANPSANQFWPDYNTGADGNDNWNTGLLEFNSSDAGKLIEVSYTGTGTLASVKANRYPAWWLDRGDGSDGDFIPESNVTISGLKQYKSVFIKAGVTVTVEGSVYMKCLTSCVVHGIINANGKGFIGGAGGVQTNGNDGEGGFGVNANGGAGGSYSSIIGGAGGTGNNNNYWDYADVAHIVNTNGCGGGGGAGGVKELRTGGDGGAGGGTIIIVSNSIMVTGEITATGDNGSSGDHTYTGSGGGGGGGCIMLIANDVEHNLNEQCVAGGQSGDGLYAGANGENGTIFIKNLGWA